MSFQRLLYSMLTSWGLAFVVEPRPAILSEYSAALETPNSQGLFGYSLDGNERDKFMAAESVLIFVLLTNHYCRCIDRKAQLPPLQAQYHLVFLGG